MSAQHPAYALIPVEPIRDGVYEATLDGYSGFAFGGALLGCGALAAARSCTDRPLAALSAHFLRPVRSEHPVQLDVETLRDGRRIAQRRVQIREDGRLGFELLARFATPRPGPELRSRPFEPALPEPDSLPSEADVARRLGWDWWEPGVIEQRWVGDPWTSDSGAGTSDTTWVRVRQPLPDDRALQVGLIAYLSDVNSHWPVARSLNGRWEPDGYSSLDEAIWFHRDLRWDDWWVLTSRCTAGHGGRAVTTRELCTRDGTRIATMIQEAIIPDPEAS